MRAVPLRLDPVSADSATLDELYPAVERTLAGQGWPEVRLGVLTGNPAALRFWQRQGYTLYDERPNTDGQDSLLLRKTL